MTDEMSADKVRSKLVSSATTMKGNSEDRCIWSFYERKAPSQPNVSTLHIWLVLTSDLQLAERFDLGLPIIRLPNSTSTQPSDKNRTVDFGVIQTSRAISLVSCPGTQNAVALSNILSRENTVSISEKRTLDVQLFRQR